MAGPGQHAAGLSAGVGSQPAGLLVGQSGLYTASYTPPTATAPLTLTWDNGTVGATAAYSWTQPGSYTVTVTATNPCMVVSGFIEIEVGPAGYWIFLPLVVQRFDLGND